MNCIIVDDEPLAREAIELLVADTDYLTLVGTFGNAASAARFMEKATVDLVFLDIQMPGITGMEFAKTIARQTLIIFTTAYSEYALDSYEVDATDYLVKPIDPVRFRRATDKAQAYHQLLVQEEGEAPLNPPKSPLNSPKGGAYITKSIIGSPPFGGIEGGCSFGGVEGAFGGIEGGRSIFVKSNRKYVKVCFDDILFVEGLKDYVILQMEEQRIITRMNLKAMYELLPKPQFFRINKSYVVNTRRIEAFDNNDIYIRNHELAIGSTYRDAFFQEFAASTRC